jgi:hypothetical protein
MVRGAESKRRTRADTMKQHYHNDDDDDDSDTRNCCVPRNMRLTIGQVNVVAGQAQAHAPSVQAHALNLVRRTTIARHCLLLLCSAAALSYYTNSFGSNPNVRMLRARRR